MKIALGIAILFFLLGPFIPGSVAASTFMIDTWESSERNDLEETVRSAHVSLENGLMDALFDSGHIFFNTYTIPDGQDDPMVLKMMPIHTAKRSGAEYLIRLEPIAENGVAYWELYAVNPAVLLDSGEVTTDEAAADDVEKIDERWYGVGSLLAEVVFSRLP